MKSYNEELDEAKLILRGLVRNYDFFASKKLPFPDKVMIEMAYKLMIEFFEHDIELARKIGNSRGKRSNGGVECDVDDGHCACGAAHKPEEISAEQLIDPEAEVGRLRKILYG